MLLTKNVSRSNIITLSEKPIFLHLLWENAGEYTIEKFDVTWEQFPHTENIGYISILCGCRMDRQWKKPNRIL